MWLLLFKDISMFAYVKTSKFFLRLESTLDIAKALLSKKKLVAKLLLTSAMPRLLPALVLKHILEMIVHKIEMIVQCLLVIPALTALIIQPRLLVLNVEIVRKEQQVS